MKRNWSKFEDAGAGIKSITLNDPDNFVQELESFLDYQLDIEKSWVFRGHANTSWTLLPQSYRHEGSFYYKGKWPFPLEHSIEQLNVEADILIEFAKLCDEVGIEVRMPSGFYQTTKKWGQEINGRFASDKSDKSFYWDSKYHEALAYAQHYGIPTRLLDFTKNPLFAALFAARDWQRLKWQNHDIPTTISVWGTNLPLLIDKDLFSYKRLDGKKYQRFKSIRMPWARNHFLQQQQGVFIIDIGSEFIRHINKIPYQPIETVVSSSNYSKEIPILTRFDLPMNDGTVNRLFELLRQKGILCARLMPTLNIVSETLCFYGRLDLPLFS